MLAPARLRDRNANVSEAAFDVQGLPVATALMGKVAAGVPETGDTVATLSFDELNPSTADVAQFFVGRRRCDEVQARTWLGQAGVRVVYHFGESIDAQGESPGPPPPPGACSIAA